MERSFRKLILAIFLGVAFLCACNPFAPALDETQPEGDALISDQTTIEGVFQNFRYAYTFKDTTIYGGLLASDFVFTYRDYERLVDESWGRDEEMRITAQLFRNAHNLNLIWNNIAGFSGDSLVSSVTRSFNLTVTFNANDIVRVDGKVRLDLRRESTTYPWRIVLWKDESNY
ncbi:MAG: hypothetical protein M5R41_14735 [Bacteroidia bacterium]|nr:hypothetical protein [Bacteroidia bacterium]